MIDFPSAPPRNKEQLFDRVRAVIDNGTFTMPDMILIVGKGYRVATD